MLYITITRDTSAEDLDGALSELHALIRAKGNNRNGDKGGGESQEESVGESDAYEINGEIRLKIRRVRKGEP